MGRNTNAQLSSAVIACIINKLSCRYRNTLTRLCERYNLVIIHCVIGLFSFLGHSSEATIRLRKQRKCLHRLRKVYRHCPPLWEANWGQIILHRIGSQGKDLLLDHLGVLTINDIRKATMIVDVPWKSIPGYHQVSDLIRLVNNIWYSLITFIFSSFACNSLKLGCFENMIYTIRQIILKNIHQKL